MLQPGGGDPFRFAPSGSLSEVLRDAGFREVQEETKTLPWTWPGTAEEVWEQMQAVAVPLGRCSIACLPTFGRRFTRKCVRRSRAMLRGKTSRSERR